MKRFSILEEMQRLAIGQTPTTIQTPTTPTTIQTPTTTTQSTQSTIYNIFTDGSCSNNGRKGAKASYGIVFLGTDENGPPKLEVSSPVLYSEPQTNQRAELSAIYYAIQIVLEQNLFKKYTQICIYTDSQYAIKCITEWGTGWQAKSWKKRDGKPVEHLDLLKPLIQLKTEFGNRLTFRYVEAHQGAARSAVFPWRWNTRADILAQNAI